MYPASEVPSNRMSVSLQVWSGSSLSETSMDQKQRSGKLKAVVVPVFKEFRWNIFVQSASSTTEGGDARP